MPLSFEQYVRLTLAPIARGHEKPSVMLLTCMDYRYAHRIVDIMDRLELRQKYDIFVLAGASAGSNQKASWRDAFVTHVRTGLAIGHPIERIVVLEHRDCGAYKHFFGLQWDSVTPPQETAKHFEQVEAFISDMKCEFASDIPGLKIDSFLLAREQDDELHLETVS